jgi:hypothetical protein
MLSTASSAFDILNALIVIIGVPSLVASFIYTGRQFQKLDTLNATMEAVKHNTNLCTFALIKMNKIDEDKVQTFSPASLTRRGNEYITDLGLKAFLDDEGHAHDLFSIIDADYPKTKYDVEVAAVKTVFEALIGKADMPQSVKIYL